MYKGMFLQPDDGILYERANQMRVKIASEHTGGTYEICEERCPPGFTSRRHKHTKDWETFIMTGGSATWTVGDETIEATKGMTIHIPPGVPHKVVVEHGCEMLVVFGPGNQAGQFEEMSKLTPEQQEDDEYKKSILAKYNMVPLE